MSDDGMTLSETFAQNGKWVLRRIINRTNDDSWQEERGWQLIDCLTGTIHRCYRGYEMADPGMGDPAARGCLGGHVSVQFSSDEECLIVEEIVDRHWFKHSEPLPDTGTAEERALAELLLGRKTIREADVLRLIELLWERDAPYPPGSGWTLHGRAIKRLEGVGKESVPALLTALEADGRPANSIVTALFNIRANLRGGTLRADPINHLVQMEREGTPGAADTVINRHGLLQTVAIKMLLWIRRRVFPSTKPAIDRWQKENWSMLIRPATVVGARAIVKPVPGKSYEQTLHFSTFQFDTGNQEEYWVGYAKLAVGDRGDLETRGPFFLGFRPRPHS